MTVAVETITEERCVVRGTGSRRGRHVWVEPGPTSARHLRYARTILDAVRQNPGINAKDVAQRTGMTGATVHYHLTRLGKVGLVESVRGRGGLHLRATEVAENAALASR